MCIHTDIFVIILTPLPSLIPPYEVLSSSKLPCLPVTQWWLVSTWKGVYLLEYEQILSDHTIEESNIPSLSIPSTVSSSQGRGVASWASLLSMTESLHPLILFIYFVQLHIIFIYKYNSSRKFFHPYFQFTLKSSPVSWKIKILLSLCPLFLYIKIIPHQNYDFSFIDFVEA